MVRYRFIVARDNAKLYEHLVRSFADVPDVQIILDRRLSERRAARVRRMGRERRLRERRTDARVQEDLRLFGWAFVRVETPPPAGAARPAHAGAGAPHDDAAPWEPPSPPARGAGAGRGESMTDDRVTVYTNVNWTGCHKATEYLSRKGVPFVERNIGLDPQAREELREMGLMSLPVIVIGERRLTGFNPAQIDAALAAR